MNTTHRFLCIGMGIAMSGLLVTPVHAWTFTMPTIPAIKFPSPTSIPLQPIDPGKIKVSIMPINSVTPSTAPTSTPTIAPTQTPTVITATPEMTSAMTESPTPYVTASPTAQVAQTSTSSATNQPMTQREKMIAGVAGLAVLALLGMVAWPKIKPWLHEKTG